MTALQSAQQTAVDEYEYVQDGRDGFRASSSYRRG